MDSVLRAAAVYVALLVIARVSGRRTLGQTTPFDLILLLIISEAIQNAMIGDDYSLTNAFLVVVTLVGMDVGLSLAKAWLPRLDRWIDGVPTLLVAHGKPVGDRLKRSRVDVSDVLAAARELQGLGRLDQVRYAVLERDGGITIIPMDETKDDQPSSRGT